MSYDLLDFILKSNSPSQHWHKFLILSQIIFSLACLKLRDLLDFILKLSLSLKIVRSEADHQKFALYA